MTRDRTDKNLRHRKCAFQHFESCGTGLCLRLHHRCTIRDVSV